MKVVAPSKDGSAVHCFQRHFENPLRLTADESATFLWRTPVGDPVSLVEAVLRVRHDCPFNSLSADFPEAKMALWCNRSREVLEVAVADDRRLREVVRRARVTLKGLHVTRHESAAITMTRRCLCARYRSVASLADAAGVWIVPPVRYFGGWETHRALSAGKAPIRRLVREIGVTGTAKVASCLVRKRFDDLCGVTAVPPNLLEDVTERQLSVLVSAFEHGLLDVPARGRMAAAASAENLSRSTYGEHLRKALHGIVRNCYPLLETTRRRESQHR